MSLLLDRILVDFLVCLNYPATDENAASVNQEDPTVPQTRQLSSRKQSKPFEPPYLGFHSVNEHLCRARKALSSIDRVARDGVLVMETRRTQDCQLHSIELRTVSDSVWEVTWISHYRSPAGSRFLKSPCQSQPPKQTSDFPQA